MYWANFLHLYQPYDQKPEILESIVTSSYRPLIKNLRKNSKVRLTLNITGSLLELFDKYGYKDLIDDLKYLGETRQVEYTGSAKYHAFLPLISESEIVRQIYTNDETCRYFLGTGYKPKGFFPPEMGYSDKVGKIVSELKYEWIIIDEIAYFRYLEKGGSSVHEYGEPHNGQAEYVKYDKIYQLADNNTLVFYRERRLSNMIMSAVVRTSDSLKEAMRKELKSNRYVITAMDAETFGHHRPGLENLLFEIFDDDDFDLVQISDLVKLFKLAPERLKPIESTWASSNDDIKNNRQFLSWYDKDNIIHKYQHEFVEMVLGEVYRVGSLAGSDLAQDQISRKIRSMMDIALGSDHFWWASAKPWWSIEMIESGAHRLLEIIESIPDADSQTVEKANMYYRKIISTAFAWQREGKIAQIQQSMNSAQKIPFKDRTLGVGGREEGVYHAFIDMMKGLEKEAREKGEYEKAILWRDAVYKIEHKLDIYDAMNAIDLLRTYIPFEEVERILNKYTAKYKEIRGGQPEQRG